MPLQSAQNITGALQLNLQSYLLLSSQVKQAHWNVVGPKFLSVHPFLDQVFAELQTAIDDTAERIRQLGEFPNGDVRLVAVTDGADALPDGKLEDELAVEIVIARIAEVVKSVRTRLGPLEDEDAVSADMIHSQLHSLEKSGWMLESVLA
jgi:starvation-inducible DNA-binding protein